MSLHVRQAPGVLGLWLHRSSLCVHLHTASLPSVSMITPFVPYTTLVTALRVHLGDAVTPAETLDCVKPV
jgi:hypothetical protein